MSAAKTAAGAPRSSAIYEGEVRHRRFGAIERKFEYPVRMLYLDLDELPDLFDRARLWSARRPAPGWLRRADYLGDPDVELGASVRELVEQRVDESPGGPIRLLTTARTLGVCFNPVSFYYCFAPGGEAVSHVVAEVTNTPWGERHAYVMRCEADGEAPKTFSESFDKELHVSPFMGMDHRYDWRLTQPAARVSVHIESHRAGAKAFDATLTMRRRAATPRALDALLLRHPLASAGVLARIYGQALALKLTGAHVHPHPEPGELPATRPASGRDRAHDSDRDREAVAR